MLGYAYRPPCVSGKTVSLPTSFLNPTHSAASPHCLSTAICHHSLCSSHMPAVKDILPETLDPNPISRPQQFHLQHTSRIGHFLPPVPLPPWSKPSFLLRGLLPPNWSPCLPHPPTVCSSPGSLFPCSNSTSLSMALREKPAFNQGPQPYAVWHFVPPVCCPSLPSPQVPSGTITLCSPPPPGICSCSASALLDSLP